VNNRVVPAPPDLARAGKTEVVPNELLEERKDSFSMGKPPGEDPACVARDPARETRGQ